MGFLFLPLWIASCAGTIYLAMKFELTGFMRLLLLNIVLPFSGFIYTVYICYYYLPREVARQAGLPMPPGPYKIYIAPKVEPYRKELEAYLRSLLKNKNDTDKRL